MVQLQRDIKQITSERIQLVAVSYDSADVLKEFATEQKITFPLLSDKDSKLIDKYKVRNKEMRKGSRQDGIPYPVTFVINEDGKIHEKLTKSVRVRHTTEELLKAAKKK